MTEAGPESGAGRFICIHGHFYQPPRENAWLEEIELQESAYPYHDWNERITAECYWPNGNARILDEQDRIRRIVNNYASMSFNVGPTLMSWIAAHHPRTYRAILEADRSSRERFSGHGSALAQAYSHAILPLCNARDQQTQVAWGLRDFEWRFGRPAEGLWLPETAVDLESLEVLARHGVRFTILAPSQAAAYRPAGQDGWVDVTDGGLDTRRPYRLELPSGRQIALFFYDAPVSQAVAFERLLTSGDRLVQRLVAAFDRPTAEGPRARLVHLATDGETYGHHHAFGEMALAYALDQIERERLARITNYGEFLELHPPRDEVRIREHTAWSCAHGLGRWSADCGCAVGSRPDWNQRWRAPLREALDWLRDAIAPRFERLGTRYLRDPWAARERYIDLILDRSPRTRDKFLEKHGRGEPTDGARTTALKLLELQRQALLMYTSCGWFFDEVSGIESVQVLQYAARAAQLAEELFEEPFEEPLLERLSGVPSNVEEYGNARRIYERRVAPARVDLQRFAANHVAGSMFNDGGTALGAAAFELAEPDRRSLEAGRSRLRVGRIEAVSRITGERADLIYGFLHMGDHNLSGSVRIDPGETSYRTMVDDVVEAFSRADFPEVLRRLEQHFVSLPYSLHTLFRDQRRRIMDQILRTTVAEAETLYERMYRQQAPLMRFLKSIDTSAPRALRTTAELVLNTRLRRVLDEADPEPARLESLLDEVQATGAQLDSPGLAYAAEGALERVLERVAVTPDDAELLRRLVGTAERLERLPFTLNLARSQYLLYRLVAAVYPSWLERANRGEPGAERRLADLRSLGRLLNVVVAPAD